MLNRRQFIGRLAALVAAVTAALLPGCTAKRAGVDMDTLGALLDTLIPGDEDPGALQAGVLDIIADKIEHDRVAMKRYRRLLPWLNQRANGLHGQPFHLLDPEQKDDLLKGLYHARSSDTARLRGDLNAIRNQCFHAFYTSPAAEAVIGYHPPILGGYPDYARAPEPRV